MEWNLSRLRFCLLLLGPLEHGGCRRYFVLLYGYITHYIKFNAEIWKQIFEEYGPGKHGDAS